MFPLGGRQGETVGLELRGGMLTGVRIAATTLERARRERESCRPGSRARRWDRREPGERSRPRITAAAGDFVVSRDPGAGRSLVPDRPGRWHPWCSTGGSIRRAKAIGSSSHVTPGQRMRIKVEASEFGSALDGVLQVLGNNGSVIANADDTNITLPARNGQQRRCS